MITTAPTLKPERIFRALSDRTRLRLLNLLRGGEVCVCDLVKVLRAPQPTISRHLAYLRKIGLIEARKCGTWSYYRLVPPASAFELSLAACVASCEDSLRELRQDRERLERERSDCCQD